MSNLDGVRVPDGTTRTLRCAAELTALVVDEPSQRTALAVRDGGCTFSGCDAPVRWCDAHHMPDWHHGGVTDVDVVMRPLDSYDFRDVGLIKIDVEGHEEAVLAGARATIAASRPILIVEIEERHNPGSTRRIPLTLAEIGYSAYFYENGVQRPVAEFDPRRHQDPARLRLEGSVPRQDLGYYNNFVFLPS